MMGRKTRPGLSHIPRARSHKHWRLPGAQHALARIALGGRGRAVRQPTYVSGVSGVSSAPVRLGNQGSEPVPVSGHPLHLPRSAPSHQQVR